MSDFLRPNQRTKVGILPQEAGLPREKKGNRKRALYLRKPGCHAKRKVITKGPSGSGLRFLRFSIVAAPGDLEYSNLKSQESQARPRLLPKTPKTKLFTTTKQSTARANTWAFSSDFIDGISQCLGQKCDWDKNSKSKDLVRGSEILDQNKVRTVDPKVIFIIGNKAEELPAEESDVDVIVKRDTFERFRRIVRTRIFYPSQSKTN